MSEKLPAEWLPPGDGEAAPSPSAPAPTNEVVRQGVKPTQRTGDRPTHVIWRATGAEMITLDGYDPASPAIAPLPAGMRGEFVRIDPAARTIVPDVERAKAWAIARIDELEQEANDRASKLARAFSEDRVWGEIKRLERDQATGSIPATAALRREEYPFLMALVDAAGGTLANVATQAKAELAAREQQIARYAARALLARRAARAASTVEAAVAAANVDLGTVS